MKIFVSLLIACTVTNILMDIRPGAEWSISGEDISSLSWLDKSQAKPIVKEINQAVSDCLTQQTVDDNQKRQAILDAKDSAKTPGARIDALMKVIDLE